MIMFDLLEVLVWMGVSVVGAIVVCQLGRWYVFGFPKKDKSRGGPK